MDTTEIKQGAKGLKVVEGNIEIKGFALWKRIEKKNRIGIRN
jgi:hypothetical protein